MNKKRKLTKIIGTIYIVAVAFAWINLFAVKLEDFGFEVLASPDALRYECRECGSIYIIPRPQWLDAPTGQDAGQKDGTGKDANEGDYTYFDYDNGLPIQVPPVTFTGLGNISYGGSPGGGITPPSSEVPCGWPSRSTATRHVTQKCNGGGCPDGATDPAVPACSTIYYNHTYPAIDIGLPHQIISTMSGIAYRCVNSLSNTQGHPSYGIYTVVVNGPYTTLYGHMKEEPGDSAAFAAGTRPVDTKCLGTDAQSNRFIVTRGQALGYTGLTGDTTGEHDHYEIRFNGANVCPADYMDYTNPLCQGVAVTQLDQVTTDLAKKAGELFSSINPLKEFLPSGGNVVNAVESLD